MQMRVLAQTAEVPRRPEYAVANEWPNQRGQWRASSALGLGFECLEGIGALHGAHCGGAREPRLRFCSEAQKSTEQKLREYLEFL